METTEEEKDFWKSLTQSNDEFEKYGIGKFWMSEAELPASMEQNGFLDVTTDYAVIDLTSDAPKYSSKMAEAMIEAMRQNNLETIQSVCSPHAEKAPVKMAGAFLVKSIRSHMSIYNSRSKFRQFADIRIHTEENTVQCIRKKRGKENAI